MDLQLTATPAMVRGVQYLAQCPDCGVVIVVPDAAKSKRELGPCPACSRNARWSHVDPPVAGFTEVTP